MYAQVIVDIVHENVAGSSTHPKTFSYRVPDGMHLSIGQRVEVPFARMIKEGIVVGFTEECDVPPEKIRDVRAPWRTTRRCCRRCWVWRSTWRRRPTAPWRRRCD